MKVQEYLLTHSLSDLAREHGVYARVADHKFSLNYDQIEARDSDEIAQECRGLVLTPSDHRTVSQDEIVGNTLVMARTMRRFFNYGQEAAAKVDFDHKETRIYEKLDGTLCILYFDFVMQKWCVATRSVPNADLPIDGFGDWTFSSLFWHSLAESSCQSGVKDSAKQNEIRVVLPVSNVPGQREVKLQSVASDLTFCFELTTPENQVVVRYDDYKVTLLSVIDNVYGEEFLPDDYASMLGVETPVSHRLSSVTELMDFVSNRDPKAFEGVVVCDHNFNRVKIKSAGYLAYNKIRDNVLKSPRALLEVILLEKLDDVSVVLSDGQKKVAFEMAEKYRQFVHQQNELFNDLLAYIAEENEKLGWRWDFGDAEQRKCFALEVQRRKANIGPMMQLYKLKCANVWKTPSFSDYINAQKDPQHGWSNAFLDGILSQLPKD